MLRSTLTSLPSILISVSCLDGMQVGSWTLGEDGNLSLTLTVDFPLIPNEISVVCVPFFSVHPESFLLKMLL